MFVGRKGLCECSTFCLLLDHWLSWSNSRAPALVCICICYYTLGSRWISFSEVDCLTCVCIVEISSAFVFVTFSASGPNSVIGRVPVSSWASSCKIDLQKASEVVLYYLLWVFVNECKIMKLEVPCLLVAIFGVTVWASEVGFTAFWRASVALIACWVPKSLLCIWYS